MPDLISITAREANQRFSELLGAVERKGEGFLVTRHGVPVARILPIEEGHNWMTPEKEAALSRLLASAGSLDIGRISREDAYADRIDRRGSNDR